MRSRLLLFGSALMLAGLVFTAEDGVSTVLQADGSVLARSRYVAIHTKDGGKWLTAMVREHAPKGERRHREELRPLAWLIGNWIDENRDSIVTFACAPVDDGNF